eukprot:1878114-Rhodomonas_salina.9
MTVMVSPCADARQTQHCYKPASEDQGTDADLQLHSFILIRNTNDWVQAFRQGTLHRCNLRQLFPWHDIVAVR